MMLEGSRALRSEVAIRIRRIGFDHHQVIPVSHAVGECPGHMPIAADGHHRGTGQGDARYPCFAPTLGRPDQRGSVPGVGHVEAQMHVVCEQRSSGRGMASRDRPVVAPERFELLRGFHFAEPQQRWQCRSGRGSQIENVGSGHGGLRFGLSDQRRIPFRSGWKQELYELGRQ